MNVVPDTNIMLSGFLWNGPPRRVIACAQLKKINLCGTPATYKEFCRIISYPRFAKKLRALHFSLQRLALDYLKLVSILPEPERQDNPIVEEDPDDDSFVYAALASQAPIIVSGDQHLLSMKQVMAIHTLNAVEMLRLVAALEQRKKPGLNRFPRHPRLLEP